MNACDAHFHVFGPEERYPYSTELRYRPPHAPLEDYLAHAAELGIGRYVFVQPSAYGRDNRCMVDAMRVIGTDKCRGIIDIVGVVKTLVNPKSTFSYSLVFPTDEPPGLYWYHPHVHGLAEAALQGGASGALVVDGINHIQPAVAGLRHR